MGRTLAGAEATLIVPDNLESLAEGTAKREKGRRSVRTILQAAFELLGGEDIGSFSMRSVAARAGVDLKNVQYYFPTRRDLVRALLECLGHQHEQEMRAVGPESETDPEANFRAALHFVLKGNLTAQIRRFNMHSWLIFDSHFGYSGEGIVQYYTRFSARIRNYVAELAPKAGELEITTRAHLITALLEGAMMTFGDLSNKEIEYVSDRLVDEAIRIGRGG